MGRSSSANFHESVVLFNVLFGSFLELGIIYFGFFSSACITLVNFHHAVTKLIGCILKLGQCVSSSQLLIEVDVVISKLLAFFGVHFVLEVAKELFECVDTVAVRDI